MHARTAIVVVAAIATATAARAEFRLERELALEPGGQFVLETDSGAVEVTGGSSSGAKVVITAQRDNIEEYFTFRFTDDGGTARVEAEKKGGLMSFWRSVKGAGLRFDVELPTNADVDVDTSGGSIKLSRISGDARLDTSGGSIKVEDLDGTLDADTSGGGIAVDAVSGSVRLDTSGGGISVEDVGGDIHADTSGGGIRIEGARGHVYASTSGGPIEVDFAPGNDRGGKLETSGGGIRVTLDPSVSLTVDAATSGGSVRSDLELLVSGEYGKSRLRGDLNGGGERLELRTSGGGIRIQGR